MRHRFPLLFALIVMSAPVHSQVSIFQSFGASNVQSKVLADHRPVFAFQLGGMATFFPLKRLPKFSIGPQISIIKNGYNLYVDKRYHYRFLYLCGAIQLGYHPTRNISVRAGMYGGPLLDTNIRQGGRTYDAGDLGVLAGISLFDRKRVSIFIEGRKGLNPILDYYSFDEQGNFTEGIHDIKHMSLMLGLKINVYYEQIRLYKN